MVFCDNCFRDEVVKKAVREAGGAWGTCPVCGKEGYLYDSETMHSLTSMFESLLSIYVPELDLSEDYPEEEEDSLAGECIRRWNIFADIESEKVNEILKSICEELYQNKPQLFDELVGIPQLDDDEYRKDHSILRCRKWETFIREIVENNRHRSNLFNEEVFQRYCRYSKRCIKKSSNSISQFYRARICEEGKLIPMEEMSAPPSEINSAGRVNAKGEVCLYLADKVETALHEIRVGTFDYVTIGNFAPVRDVYVADFRRLTSISPFQGGIEILEYAINKPLLVLIDREMSKPVRRGDNPNKYISTQYITDVVRSIVEDGKPVYDGMAYSSTIYEGGLNFAIFDPSLFCCRSVWMERIGKVSYERERQTGNHGILRLSQQFRVLVTGANTSMGRCILRELANRNYENVLATDMDCTFDIGEDRDLLRVNFEQVDYTNYGQVENCVKQFWPHCIICCSSCWNSSIIGLHKQDGRFWDGCFAGVKNIAKASQMIGSAMMYLSTGSALEREERIICSYFKEDGRKRRKFGCGEAIAKDELNICRTLDKYIILSAPWVYGPDRRNFVKSLINKAKISEDVCISDIKLGIPTYMRDLARLTVDMSNYDGYGYYEVSNSSVEDSDTISTYDFCVELFKQCGIDAKITPNIVEEIDHQKDKLLVRHNKDMKTLDLSRFTPLPDWKDALARYLQEEHLIRNI